MRSDGGVVALRAAFGAGIEHSIGQRIVGQDQLVRR
jgi:hypothetical protein